MIQSRSWKVGLALLSTYGFFIEMKPSEPYLTPYLTTTKQFTNDTVNNSIYPYWTYGQLIIVFFVPLMSKFITPKRMFYLETTGFIVTRVLLLGGSSLLSMQFMQLTYAIGTSIKAIYYCYVYLIFEREYYGIVTGVVWGASALGTCVSGVLGQILVNDGVSYLVLNYISMGSVCVAFVLAFFIPDAKYESLTSATTMTDDDGDVVVDTSTINGDKGDCESSGNIAIENIITATFPDSFEDDVNDRPSGTGGYYNNVANTITAEYMQVFSLFRDNRGPMAFTWILTKCVEELVQNYASNLWYDLSDDPRFYGTAIALYQGCGVIGALFPVMVRVVVKDEPILSATIRIIQGIASVSILASLVVMTVTDDLRMAYLSYVTFGLFYHVFITGVSCSMASNSRPLEQVFLFAANLFCATAMETIVTVVLASRDARPRVWFGVICILQGVTVPVYFYQSYVQKRSQI